MANKFTAPFADGGTKRQPSAAERFGGFPCGPADATLFNGLFHAIQAELGHLVTYAGLTDSDEDLQQVRKAIEALIASAIGDLGEGEEQDLSPFLLTAQARVRLPILPRVENSSNSISVTQPSGGVVAVPAGVTVMHRGIYPLSTSEFEEGERQFATLANKTYHVRLSFAVGAEALSLKDLSNVGYNPSALAEDDVDFATTEDDMLLARVVTNGSNIATITNFVNNGKWPTRDGMPWWVRVDNVGQAAQTVARNTLTKVNNLAISSGNIPASAWSKPNGRLTVKGVMAGLWTVHHGANLLEEALEERHIYRNGVYWSRSFAPISDVSSGTPVTTVMPLAHGDYAELFYRHAASSSRQSGQLSDAVFARTG